ncbi:MAG: hypothetical protein HY260_10100 [Chloroflexi bacterium]|nr:hypothetical protein [Chloroflexota bacterium]
MAWYTAVRTRLQDSELFIGVELVGGKVRATVDANHFQERTADGKWRFMPSEFRGNIEVEIETVIDRVRQFLGKSTAEETPDTTQ